MEVFLGSAVPAADVKILASNSVRTMLEDVAPLFARASGHKVTLGFGTSAQVTKRVIAGEVVDLLVVTPDVVDTLAKAGKLAGAVGSLPPELQLTTHLSAVVGAGAAAPDAARALVMFFTSPEAAAAMRARGLEPGSGS
jgi:ABC-type molybdate transport system substrate-binding protein